MRLHWQTCLFVALVTDVRQKAKVETTLEILQLNDRDALIESRQATARTFYDHLERLIKIQAATTKNNLFDILHPNENRFDKTKSLNALKAEILESYKNYIQKHAHPSVWFAIKTDACKRDSKWKNLFEKLPMITEW